MLLLLLKRRLAVPVLLGSFLAMIVTSIHNFFLSNGPEVVGGGRSAVFNPDLRFCPRPLALCPEYGPTGSVGLRRMGKGTPAPVVAAVIGILRAERKWACGLSGPPRRER